MIRYIFVILSGLSFLISQNAFADTYEACMNYLKSEMDDCTANYSSVPDYILYPISDTGDLAYTGVWEHWYQAGCTLTYPSTGTARAKSYCHAPPPTTIVPPPNTPVGPPSCHSGSIIRTDNMTVSEEVPLTGTNFKLVYASDRVIGRFKSYHAEFPLPAARKISKFHARAGYPVLPTQVGFVLNFPDGRQFPLWVYAGSTGNFNWDGKNASGDYSEAPTTFTVHQEIYGDFYSYSSDVTSASQIGTWNVKQTGLGGWNLDNHHRYFPEMNKLFLGSGETKLVTASQDTTGYQVLSESGDLIYYFDFSGRHLTTRNSLTNSVLFTFNYDINGFIANVVDAYGNTTSILRNGSGVLTGIQSPYGQITNLTVGSDGYLSSIQNPNGEAFSMTYYSGGLLNTFQKPAGQISTMSYDAEGNLYSDSSSAGNYIGLWKNTDGTQIYVSDVFGIKQTSNLALGDTWEQRTDNKRSGQTSSMYYEKDAQLTNNDGKISSQTLYSANPRFPLANYLPTGNYISFLSMPQSFSKSETLTVNNTSASPTPYNFDSIVKQTTKNGRISNSTYTRSTGVTNFSSPMGKTSYVMTDTYGKLIESRYANFTKAQFSYDLNGRLKYITQGARQTELQYNASGDLSGVKNPLNQTTNLSYDLAGRVQTVTLPDARTIGYTYDSNGNVASIIPPTGIAHNFSFNAFDLVGTNTPPTVPVSTPSTYYYYNNAKQITQITRPDLSTVIFNYDNTTRLLTSIVSSGDTTSFTLSPNGEVAATASQDGVAISQAVYDGLLANSSTTNSASLNIGTLSYTYNNDLLPTNLTVSAASGSNSINYTYDNDGLMKTAGSLAISLDATTGIPTKTTLNKIQEISSFDLSYGEPTYFLAKYVNGTTTTPLYSESFTRDALGRIQARAETVGTTTNQFVYTYDSAGRLTDVTKNSVAYSHYNFSSNNNLTSGNVGGVAFSATYDAQDRLSTYNSDTYVHNVNGELQSKTVSGVTTTYTYNGFGMLKTAKVGTGPVFSYLYDGFNRRVGKKSGSTVQKYWVYQDQIRIGAEVNSSGAITKKFIYGTKINIPDYIIIGSTTYKIVSDHLGSVRQVVNAATGAISQAIEYNERGEVLSDTSPGFQPFGFAGGLWDTDTKLIRFGARDYDPSIGRFISKDPMGFRGGDTNLYGYVLNDPVNMIDPIGLFAIEVGGGVLGQAGLFGGGAGTNFAFSFDFGTGQWQTGQTTSVQANIGGGLYGGAGGQASVTPGAHALCDLGGTSYGAGGAAGTGLAGASGQVTFGSAGPTFTGSIPFTGAGAGVAGYGVVNNTSVQVINQGNLYNWFSSAIGF